MFIQDAIDKVKKFFQEYSKRLLIGFLGITACMLIALSIGKTYQHWDDDEFRGAVEITDGEFDENYEQPVYLDQGWNESDSLWFYNTTQGSDLLPYDIYVSLERPDSETLFKSNEVYDKYRYLPQNPTFFNPDGLAVGFVKDTYKGKQYLGYTCAACHTGQVNYQGKAIRIDGGPAMADMVGYLTEMQLAMEATLKDKDKQKRFVDAVLSRKGDYKDKNTLIEDLELWTRVIQNYNGINHSKVDYGYARLDAFGRIFNRVLQHVINKPQARNLMLLALKPDGSRILTTAEVDLVLEGIDETIIGNEQFGLIMERLMSKDTGYPGLNLRNMLRIRDALFNEPNAPVSYPFLWDITHSDYVQWNGIAGNAGPGALGRNAGEVIGVFAKLDWEAKDPGFSLSAKISGQDTDNKIIKFQSSINLVNLQRLENQLTTLQSPVWPEDILGKIDPVKKEKGQLHYAKYCQSCHEVINRSAWDRLVTAQMASLDEIGTDPAMAENSVNYIGKSGNFQNTYQTTDVGTIVLKEDAPVAAILTAATRGVVATPDYDKNFLRRRLMAIP